MNKFFIYFANFIIFSVYSHYVCSPVADCFGYNPTSKKPYTDFGELRKFVGAYSSFDKYSRAGMRCAQLLFNQRVRVIGESKNMYIVVSPNFFYERDNRKDRRYCVEKRHIKKINSDLSYVVPKSEKNMVFLKKPYKDHQEKILFSVGTSFVMDQSNECECKLIYIHPHKNTVCNLIVPREMLYIPSLDTSEDVRSIFTSILRDAACSASSKFLVPYVWGGISLGTLVKKENMEKVDYKEHALIKNKDISLASCSSLYGPDCSGVIVLLLSMFGYKDIPRTTCSMLRHFPRCKSILQNGDLLCYNGHVYILDVENNSVIHEAGYSVPNGGGLIKQKLSDVFIGIKTIEDLYVMWKKQKTLRRTGGQTDIKNYELLSPLEVDLS